MLQSFLYLCIIYVTVFFYQFEHSISITSSGVLKCLDFSLMCLIGSCWLLHSQIKPGMGILGVEVQTPGLNLAEWEKHSPKYTKCPVLSEPRPCPTRRPSRDCSWLSLFMRKHLPRYTSSSPTHTPKTVEKSHFSPLTFSAPRSSRRWGPHHHHHHLRAPCLPSTKMDDAFPAPPLLPSGPPIGE